MPVPISPVVYRTTYWISMWLRLNLIRNHYLKKLRRLASISPILKNTVSILIISHALEIIAQINKHSKRLTKTLENKSEIKLWIRVLIYINKQDAILCLKRMWLQKSKYSWTSFRGYISIVVGFLLNGQYIFALVLAHAHAFVIFW